METKTEKSQLSFKVADLTLADWGRKEIASNKIQRNPDEKCTGFFCVKIVGFYLIYFDVKSKSLI